MSLDNIRFKGVKKVKVYELLNCITLIARTIVVNLDKLSDEAI
ncbi:hypothetical protein [Sporanaerobacter sp.]